MKAMISGLYLLVEEILAGTHRDKAIMIAMKTYLEQGANHPGRNVTANLNKCLKSYQKASSSTLNF